MEARRSPRSQIRDWTRLKEFLDEGDTIPAASEGGAMGPQEGSQGFSVERARVTVRRHYKRTQWALLVVSRYRRNLALGSPVLAYPTEPLFVTTRGGSGFHDTFERHASGGTAAKANRLREVRKARRDASARSRRARQRNAGRNLRSR